MRDHNNRLSFGKIINIIPVGSLILIICYQTFQVFFPFPDCVEECVKAGITAIIQPGGSIQDKASVEACNAAGIAMVFVGDRHFKH